MVNLDVAELRSKLNLETKYVEFSLIRTSLTVTALVADLNISLLEPTKEGECRGKCPKCGKDRSFVLNIETNRFNCFAKGCILKGGGVIDFYSKLLEVTAKEASHLLACAYGIQPYAKDSEAVFQTPIEKPADKNLLAEPKREVPQDPADDSQTVPPLTAQHLIASIEHNLDQLKQIISRQ
jgi:hypothetical protein